MNKLAITILSTLVLTLSGSLYAQDGNAGPGKHRHFQKHGMQDMPVVDGFMRSLRHLDLDDSQKAGVKSIVQTMKADLKPVMEATKDRHMQLRDLINAGTFDEDAVAAIAKQEGDLAAEKIMVTSRAMSSALQLLTDEQRAELQTMSEERQERRHERRNSKNAEG